MKSLNALIRNLVKEEVLRYEDDISAEEETEIKSSWFQSQNEYSRRKKSVSCQKSKRKSKIICLIPFTRLRAGFTGMFCNERAARNCGLLSYTHTGVGAREVS